MVDFVRSKRYLSQNAAEQKQESTRIRNVYRFFVYFRFLMKERVRRGKNGFFLHLIEPNDKKQIK